MQLSFHQLTLSDREAMQAVTLNSGRRNCNYTFANLLGWQFLYKTEVCVLQDTVVLRYIYAPAANHTVARAVVAASMMSITTNTISQMIHHDINLILPSKICAGIPRPR